jgi:hypothetical protein
MGFLEVLTSETENLGWQRLEGRGLSERLRPPEFFIYRAGEEIVARDRGAYPKKFGMWKDFLSRTVVGSFEIPIRFDWFGCVAVGMFSGPVLSRLPNELSRDCSMK